MALARGPRTRTLSHLLLSGSNPLSPPLLYSSPPSALPQRPSNPSLVPVPLTSSWLSSIGREGDVPSRLLLASGAGHSLAAYTSEVGVDRVLGLGKNEAGQLGIGFASQEGTRGLVEGFEGEGVLQVAAGVQGSYLLVSSSPDSTTLYSFGNLARGRLGHRSLFPPDPPLEKHEEPRQHVLPRAVAVKLPEEMGKIKQIAAGFEHLLMLTEDGEIYGTGCNTDGQLGLGPSSSLDGGLSDVFELSKLSLPEHIRAHEGGVKSISAGADTSALITESGKVFAWGNSEYGQAFHSRTIDQIPTPLEIDSSFLPSPSRRIVDFRCGGSFSLVLDDQGSVSSAGFGAVGLGKSTLNSLKPQLIEALEGEGVSRIRAGWGYAAAVRDAAEDSALWTWGLNNLHGRLGLGALPSSPTSSSPSSSPSPSSRFSRRDSSEAPPAPVQRHVCEPTRVDLAPAVRSLGLELGRRRDGEEGGRWRLGEVELGEEGMWVEVKEEVDVD
ncbi:hypothetical protein JCM8547_000504 [Rhodosporidiobolus lusitaniae]